MRTSTIQLAIDCGAPSPIYGSGGPRPEPNVVLKHENVIAEAGDNDLPSFHMRAGNGHFLTGHLDPLLDAKTRLQSLIGLNVELIAESVGLIDISRRRNCAAVARVHGGKPARQAGKAGAVISPEAGQLPQSSTQALWLPGKVHD